MSFSKKAISIALTATTAVWASGALLIAAPAYGATTAADLQAQIAALLAQIQQLQGQLGTSGGATATASYTFTRDLTVGSTGADVTALQGILIGGGYLKIAKATTYFGNLTKAALAAWQKAQGITPAAGYFGPKTRAAIAASMTTGGTTTGGTTTGGTTTGGTTTGGTTPAPAGGLLVSLASNNPAAGALISSTNSAAARVPVMAVTLTAGNASGITVSDLKFHKTGVVSDSSISGAYLVEGGRVLYQYGSLGNGVIDFPGMALNLAAGQSRTLWLAIDPASGLSAGNTVGFAISSASDITATNATNATVTAAGLFPLSGNMFTVTSVSNPAIASATFTSQSVGSTVYAGTQNVLVSQWNVSVNNSPVNLTSLNFKVVGSATKTDIKNLKLFVNGTQVGSTLPSVGSDGNAYFDLTSSPAKLSTGSSNMQVYADIMGSPSFQFQFELLNNYDIYAVDTQYNVPVSISISGGAGTQVTINQGQITLSLDTNTPTGNIALGGSGTTLMKLDLYAAGEAVKTKFLDVTLTKTGGVAWSATPPRDPNLDLKNIQLVDDAGNQIGTTISSIANGTGSGQCGIAGTVLTCHFGTSGSPINYIVPANTTRVISVKADVQSGATFTNIVAALPTQQGNNNLQGLTSSQLASSGSVTGSSLSLSLTPLTATINSSFASQTYAKGANAVKVGSYVLTASSAEGENVNNFSVSFNNATSSFQNLKAMVGTTQIGSTYPTLATTGTPNYTFAGTVNVPAGGTAVIDLYADVLTSATGAMGAVSSFVSCTGTGASTFSSVSCSGTPSGQSITVSSGPTLTLSNNNSGANRQVVLGGSQISLAKVLLRDTAGIEPIRIQELTFGMNSASAAAFNNLKLYDASGNLIAGVNAVAMTGTAPNFVADFNFGNAATITIPQAGTLPLELRGDATTFTVGGGGIEGATTAVSITATSSVTAFGKSSNTPVTVSGTPSFSTVTTLRSKLNLAGATLGASDSACAGVTGGAISSRSRTSNDYIGCLKFSADPSGQDVDVNTLTLTFTGGALNGATSPFHVDLIDPNTGSNYDGSTQKNCTISGTTCTATFAFNGTPITGTKGVAVRIDSSGFTVSANLQTPLDVNLQARTDVNWGDGPSALGATNTGLSLSSDVTVPLTLMHVSYQ